MADYSINAKTSVDVSGLKGYQTAAEAAATATQRLSVAMDAAASSSRALATSIASSTTNLNAFSQAASATMTAATAATGAVNQLASALSAVAQVNIATALNAGTAAVQAQSAATQQLSTSYGIARLAGRALIQEIGGPMSFVFGQIAAQSAILGPILEAAFPLIAFAAVVDILVTIYDKFTKITEAEKKAAEEANKLDREIRSIGEDLARTENSKFSLQYGEAAVKAREAAEYTVRARTEAAALAIMQLDAARQAAEIQKDTAIEQSLSLAGGVSFSKVSSALKDKIKLYDNTRLEIQKIQTQQELDQAKANLASNQSLRQSGDDYQAQQNKMITDSNEAAARALRAKREATAALRDADTEALSDLKANHELTINETIKFWEARLADESDNVDRYKEITRTLGNLYQEQDKAFDRVVRRGIEIGTEKARKELENQEKTQRYFDEVIKLLDEYADKAEEVARREADIQIKTGADIGGASQQQKKLELQRAYATSLDQSFSAQQKLAASEIALDQVILQNKLNADAQLIASDKKKGIQVAKDEKQMVDDAIAGQQKIYAAQTNALAQQAAQYHVFFNTITNGFTNAVTGWLTGERTFASGLRGIWTGLISDFAKMVEQRVIAWATGTAAIQAAEGVLQNVLVALHLATAATTKTVDTAVATTAAVDDKAASEIMVIDAAGVAAANAYAATAIIPFIGPALAPAAASTALAATLAFGQFEKGTDYVPRTGPYILHQGERVVTAAQNAAGGAGMSFGDTHIHVNGGNGGKQAGMDAATQFQNMIRRKNLVMA